MKGRAKSAPLLRKKKVDDIDESNRAQMDGGNDFEVCVLKDNDENREVVVHEAGRHDAEVWPHLHSPEQIKKLFPLVVAVPEIETIGNEERDEHAILHRRWAGVRLTVSRG